MSASSVENTTFTVPVQSLFSNSHPYLSIHEMLTIKPGPAGYMQARVGDKVTHPPSYYSSWEMVQSKTETTISVSMIRHCSWSRQCCIGHLVC